MIKAFEFIDISGDAGIRATGGDMRELFMNAALGMYSLVADPDSVRATRSVCPSASGASLEGLLVSWLNELVFLFDAHGFIGKTVHFTEFVVPSGHADDEDRTGSIEPWHAGGSLFRLSAVLSGEDFDPARHEGRLLIKAATYHGLKIEKKGAFWEAEIIFDI